MVHAGVPLDDQRDRWPGSTYSLPSVAWMGPHYSAAITGIARAGIGALIALAVEKTPRGRNDPLWENPQARDAGGRADAMLNARRVHRSGTIGEPWKTVAAGGEITPGKRARCRLASTRGGARAREAMDLA